MFYMSIYITERLRKVINLKSSILEEIDSVNEIIKIKNNQLFNRFSKEFTMNLI